ncbi:MAG TPA: tripartite tricarboxylate transporter substrate binding protein [Candidatus Methylomirabilis sp.]|nr:tripartite tricarboxylate transporter substrate binding protein [Candidatus Methylomirabilis sp.]
MKRLVAIFAILLLSFAAVAVAPAADYPAKGKSITMILGTSAGGSTDVGARILAAALEKDLAATETRIQVENKPGAGWQIGLTALARSRPDGYTIGFTILPQTITNYLDPERKAVFDRKSFQPLGMQVVDPGVIAVKASSPYKTLKDVIEAAKATPGKLKASATGILSDDHLAVLQLEKLTGAKFAIVQFDGSAKAMTALLGGHTDVYFGNIGDTFPQAKAGEVRVLCVMDDQESKFLPGKTSFSQGIKLESSSSRGLSAPTGTPKDVVDFLAGAIKKAIDNPDHMKKMEEQGLTVRYMDPAGMQKYWSDMEEQIRPLMSIAKEK